MRIAATSPALIKATGKRSRNSEWQRELPDGSRKPVFMVALVAETLPQELPLEQVIAASQIEP
jgi:hypothetical protein